LEIKHELFPKVNPISQVLHKEAEMGQLEQLVTAQV
jgi:hypothetical protein